MKKVVITGGQGDIAKAIKELLQSEGYEVYSPGRLELDVTDIESVQNYFNNIVPDILINNAGHVVPQSIKQTDIKIDKTSIDVNLFGVFNCTGAVLAKNPKAKIINVGSSAATRVHGTWSAYCAAKAAVVMATKCWADDGVDAVCISPGRTATKMRSSLFQNEDPNTLLKTEEFAQIIKFAVDGCYAPGEHINVNCQNVDELIKNVVSEEKKTC